MTIYRELECIFLGIILIIIGILVVKFEDNIFKGLLGIYTIGTGIIMIIFIITLSHLWR